MIKLILTMLAGIILGKIISHKKTTTLFGKLIFPVVIVLLFFMGIAIGKNDAILKNFSSLGLQAFVITMGAVTGAAIGGFIIYRILLKYNKIR